MLSSTSLFSSFFFTKYKNLKQNRTAHLFIYRTASRGNGKLKYNPWMEVLNVDSFRQYKIAIKEAPNSENI